uniref:Uncharacterized protein n=1 Tax=Cacopsylla melanoneura TaxID=428564 RepID=A0A8D8RK13_9HEMI
MQNVHFENGFFKMLFKMDFHKIKPFTEDVFPLKKFSEKNTEKISSPVQNARMRPMSLGPNHKNFSICQFFRRSNFKKANILTKMQNGSKNAFQMQNARCFSKTHFKCKM